jgi:phosphohistidine phosphatase SixA
MPRIIISPYKRTTSTLPYYFAEFCQKKPAATTRELIYYIEFKNVILFLASDNNKDKRNKNNNRHSEFPFHSLANNK